MNNNRKLRLQILAQNWLFVVLFLVIIAMLAALTRQFSWSYDYTQSNRNTLTQGSINILKQMPSPVHIQVFASKDDVSKNDQFRKKYADFINRYKRSKSDITYEFIDPAEQPKITQDAGIKVDGEFVVEYNKRVEHITPPFVEQDFTNLLVRLSRTNQHPIMYMDGHGERNLIGIKNFDLGEFGKQLAKRGFTFANPDLTIAQEVPSNGSMLVIAAPQVEVTAIEVQKIIKYVENGGNVLWLLDDNKMHGLQPLADYLNLNISTGMVVDLSSAKYGGDAKLALARTYGEHPITKNFMLLTAFPEAREVTAKDSFDKGWKVSNLIDVAPNGWLESGKVDDKMDFSEKSGDKRGPINIAVAMERDYGKKGQRVLVVGNGNFLSNTFIANGGNLDLGANMINWLANDDSLITIQPKPLKDMNMLIPATASGQAVAWIVFFGFKYIIPSIFLITGLLLWLKRRKA